MDDYLQYLFENDIKGPIMPFTYFGNPILHDHSQPYFPTGDDSSVCVNYSDDAIQKAVNRFSVMVLENGNTRFKVQHNDVGLSQESYEAPEYITGPGHETPLASGVSTN
eukprot:scaffold29705_cov99-Amphora_coffeaeformis.AAC.1